MMKRAWVVVSVVCLALLQAPTSEAGLADFIWGLSGPRMLGVGGGCRWDFGLDADVCQFGTGAPAAPVLRMRVDTQPDTQSARTALANGPRDHKSTKGFFSLGGVLYWSTGKDTGSGSTLQRYSPGDVWMLAIEPSVSIRHSRLGGLPVYHGFGPTFDYLFGARRDYNDASFESFWNNGFKVTLAEVPVRKLRTTFAANVRLYPDGFTDDQFLPGPHRDFDRPFEAVWGGSVSIILFEGRR